jgi:hypothetical protein
MYRGIGYAEVVVGLANVGLPSHRQALFAGERPENRMELALELAVRVAWSGHHVVGTLPHLVETIEPCAPARSASASSSGGGVPSTIVVMAKA